MVGLAPRKAAKGTIIRGKISETEKRVFMRINWAIILVFHALNLWLIVSLVQLVNSWYTAATAIIALFLGAFLVDSASYIGHWMIDNYGTENTPLLGKKVILPFRVHHDDPMELTTHGFIEANGNTCAASLPCSILTLVILNMYPPFAGDEAAIWLVGFVIGFWGLFSLSNQMHIWSHMNEEDLPTLVRFLQSVGICIPRENHHKHHKDGARGHYALVTGWSNELLEFFRVGRILETLIRIIFGIEPVTKLEIELSADEINNRKASRFEEVTFPCTLFALVYFTLWTPTIFLVRNFVSYF